MKSWRKTKSESEKPPSISTLRAVMIVSVVLSLLFAFGYLRYVIYFGVDSFSELKDKIFTLALHRDVLPEFLLLCVVVAVLSYMWDNNI